MFPNVFAADDPTERAELDRRYQLAINDAISRTAGDALKSFQDAVEGSKAVISRSVSEVLRLATNTRQLYGTYYQLREAGLRLPDGDHWDSLRELADTLLFPGYKEKIRFGALSLDGVGLRNYGECSISLRDDMISHRTSAFEENSALFVERHNIEISRKAKVPRGFRATWNDRSKLCVAKLFPKIDSATTDDEYSGLLIKPGTNSENDEFVEVHIWGPMTVLTMERVVVTAPKRRQRATILKAIKFKLEANNVRVS